MGAKMQASSDIKILISCHKEIDYPENDVYLPVHVGAQNAAQPLAGMQPDNEGENISDRNFTFCELTAQYWAWKNLEADYIGLCHYRRYFCFGQTKEKPNDHAQIVEPVLSPFSIRKYRLDDAALIREAVGKADLIRAPYWDVAGSLTPSGKKRSIREHMVGYGLFTDKDVDKLIEIVSRLAPEYKDSLIQYLDGSKYLGYNCFVMRRDLFERLCEFEFPVLLEFDRQFTYENMTTTRKRICGYFGEILYSVFVNRIAHEGKYSIAEYPLVFFDDTSPLYRFDQLVDHSDLVDVDIVWRYTDASAARFSIVVDSLIDAINPNTNYRLTIVHEPQFKIAELKRFISQVPANLVLRDATFPVIGIDETEKDLSVDELDLLLPFGILQRLIASCCGRVIWIDGCGLFEQDPYKLFDCVGDSGIAVMDGIHLEKELNKPGSWHLLDRYLEVNDGWNMYDSALMLFDAQKVASRIDGFDYLSSYRDACNHFGFNLAHILKSAKSNFAKQKTQPGSARDQFYLPLECMVTLSTMLRSLRPEIISFDCVLPVLSFGDTTIWANEEHAKKWSSVDASYAYLFKPESGPFLDNTNVFCSKYWRRARQSDAYETLLTFITAYRPTSLKDRVLPPYSKRRRLLGRIRRVLRRLLPIR